MSRSKIVAAILALPLLCFVYFALTNSPIKRPTDTISPVATPPQIVSTPSPSGPTDREIVPVSAPDPTPSEVEPGPQGSQIQIFKNAAGEVEMTRQIDGRGQPIKITRNTEDGEERTEFVYDSAGQLLRERVFLNGRLRSQTP